MATALLLLTNALTPSSEVLPALSLLGHPVRVAPAEVSALLDAPQADAVLNAGGLSASSRADGPPAADGLLSAPLCDRAGRETGAIT